VASGTKIGDAYIAVDADTRQAKSSLKGLDDQVTTTGKGLGGLGGKFTPTAIAAGAAVAAGAIFEFGKAAVDASANLTESINAINVVYGESASAIHALGEESADSFGLSQRAFNEFATQFSAFGEKIATGTGQDVGVVVEDLTTRIADFASVMNLDMSEAATVFQSALAGETESFRRFGGDVSAAAVEVKALELGLGEASGELSEQDKILARYELVMEQTEKTAGDFANTSDSLANQQRILAANLEDTQAKIGKFLVPAVAEATGAFNDLLTIVSAVTEALGEEEGLIANISNFAEGAIRMLPGISQIITAWEIGTTQLGLLADATENTTTTQQRLQEQQNDALGAQADATLAAYNAAGAANAQSQALDMVTLTAGPAYLEYLNDQSTVTENVTEDTYDAVAALDAYQNKIRAQTDPIFALFQANRDLAAAEENVETVRADATATADDITAAELEHAEALRDVFFAEQDVRTQTDLNREELENQLEVWGLSAEAAQDLVDKILLYNETEIDPKTAEILLRTRYEAARDDTGGGFFEGLDPNRQMGGPVMAGHSYTVGEAGPETFVPNVSGTILPTGVGTGNGVNVTQNFYTEPVPTPQTQRAMQEAAAVIGMTQ
jgi:hypothetical protein